MAFLPFPTSARPSSFLDPRVMSINKRKRLSLNEKIEILKLKDAQNLSVRTIAERFDVGKTQVYETFSIFLCRNACNVSCLL